VLKESINMIRVEPSSKFDRFYDQEGTALLQANGGYKSQLFFTVHWCFYAFMKLLVVPKSMACSAF